MQTAKAIESTLTITPATPPFENSNDFTPELALAVLLEPWVVLVELARVVILPDLPLGVAVIKVLGDGALIEVPVGEFG